MSLTDIFNSIVNYQITDSMVISIFLSIGELFLVVFLPIILSVLIYISAFIWIDRHIAEERQHNWLKWTGIGCVALVFLVPFLYGSCC